MNVDTTKEDVSNKIEKYVKKHNIGYIDAVITISDSLEMDYSVISKLLTKPIIEKIQEEGRNLNLLKKIKNKLPFH